MESMPLLLPAAARARALCRVVYLLILWFVVAVVLQPEKLKWSGRSGREIVQLQPARREEERDRLQRHQLTMW